MQLSATVSIKHILFVSQLHGMMFIYEKESSKM